MRSKTSLTLLITLLMAVLVLPAATAGAQPYRHGHVRVHVGVGWGYPAWGWGYPYWGMGWGWGGYWGPWGYPYMGYPGYYGPRDNSAEVKLEVKPKDAQVFVNGYYAGLVDDFDGTFQRLHLAPGDHEIVLYLEGYRTVKQTIRVRPREDAKIRYALEPLPAGEKAEPPPPPPPEEEQQQQQPTAPGSRRPAPSGQPAPSIRAEARGFGTLVFRIQPVKQTIRVRPREDAKIRYALEPLPAGEKAEPPPPPPPEEEQQQQQQQQQQPTAPGSRRPAPSGQPAPSIRAEARGFGTLVFRIQPVGAEILIDGERWQGPEGDERLVVQVSEGSHRVEIRKEGFVPYTGEVTVEGGGTTPLNVSLPPRGE